jgi:hypothetical protein
MKNQKRNGKMSRAAWIRAQPKSLSPAEVVKAGTAAGYKMTLAAVHKTRWLANGSRSKSALKSKASSTEAKTPPSGTTSRARLKNANDLDRKHAGLATDVLVGSFRSLIQQAVREELRSMVKGSAFFEG